MARQNSTQFSSFPSILHPGGGGGNLSQDTSQNQGGSVAGIQTYQSIMKNMYNI